jgi:hypothetical protein
MMALLPKSMSLAKLPAKTYQGQDKEVNVFGLSTYLVAATRLPDDVVHKVVKALFDNIAEFHAFHAEAKEWTLAEAVSDPKIPYHPGAIRYFKEKGVWSADLDKTQAELQRK